MDDSGLRSKIKDCLINKANLQQKVYDNTFAVFNTLKEALHEMSSELNEELDEAIDRRIKIEYRDRGKFEAQLQVAGDVLIFNMHTNVFEFNREHEVWNNPYVQNDRTNTYCGIINIYNFLADTFKYNRANDEGYLIGRIFINKDKCFFVEGKHSYEVKCADFGNHKIDEQAVKNIIESAIYYSLEFDLLVPPYDVVKTVIADQMSTKFENTKMQTGKRLGYGFNSDDI